MSVRRFDLDAGADTFDFAPETEPKIDFWLSKYPENKKRSAVIPMLWLAQKDNDGWLSEPAMREVADRLDMAYIRVYEVATFYTMFNLKPVGRYHVQLCGTTPCMLRGANDLKDVCSRKIGKKGGVTDDGRLSWEEVECLGACVNAPMVQINDYYYEDLTPETFENVLEKLATGVDVDPGTFVDRQTSAPIGGATTLTDEALYNGSAGDAIAALPNATDSDRPGRAMLKGLRPQSPTETVRQPTPDSPLKAPNDDGSSAASTKQTSATRKPAGGKPADTDSSDRSGMGKFGETQSFAQTSVATSIREEAADKPSGISEARNGQPDDLKRISGVGPVIEQKLHGLGIYHFDQIAAWTDREVQWVDGYLSFKGRIGREDWIAQAKTLAGGVGNG